MIDRINKGQKVFAAFTFLLISSYIILKNYQEITLWRATHWIFSVKKGIYSRAFLGTFLDVTIPNYYGKLAVINVLSLLVVFVLSLLLVYLAYQYYNRNQGLASILVMLVFLSSPGAISYLAVDIGRLDQVGYLIVILFMLLYTKIPDRMRMLSFSITLILLVLIHEVFLVLLGSLLIAYILFVKREELTTFKKVSYYFLAIILASLPAIVIAFLMLTKARFIYSPESLRDMMIYLRSFVDFDISKDAVLIHFRTISDNTGFTKKFVSSGGGLIQYTWVASCLVPWMVVAVSLIVRMLKNIHYRQSMNKIINIIIFGLLLMPVSLFLIGIDYPRWIASVNLNLFLLLTVGTINKGTEIKALRLGIFTMVIMTLIIVVGIYLGGITATQAPSKLVELFAIS